MATQTQIRRGTHAQVAAFAGAVGEVVDDTTQNRLVVQDGSTLGGFPLAKLSEIQGASALWKTVGGTGDAITLTSSVPVSSLVAGLQVIFQATANNTLTNPTISLDGLTSKTIKKNNGALVANDLISGQLYTAVYDGTNFQFFSGLGQVINSNLVMANATGGAASAVGTTVTALIDAAIGSTRGTLLERGASGWALLGPGTVNQPLVSQGAGADPTFESVSTLIDAAIGSTRGTLLERGASGWALLGPGTVNQPLVSQGAGADPTFESVSTLLDAALAPGIVQGSVAFRSAAAWKGTTVGIAGQFLQSNGPGSDPTFVYSTASLLVNFSIPNASTIDSGTGLWTSSPQYVLLRINNLTVDTDGVSLLFKVYMSGALQSANYYSAEYGLTSAAIAAEGVSGATSITLVDSSLGNGANDVCSGEIEIFSSTSTYSVIKYNLGVYRTTGAVVKEFKGIAFCTTSASSITGFKIFPSAGNFTTTASGHLAVFLSGGSA